MQTHSMNSQFRLNEKGALQYNWSLKDNKKLISELQFQMTLSKSDYNQIHLIHKNLLQGDLTKEEKTILYKLLAYTRDIKQGKGIYSWSYVMLYNFADYDFKLFQNMFNDFIGFESSLEIPYGSHKDAKYFIDYCTKNFKNSETTTAIKDYIYSVWSKILNKDMQSYKNKEKTSLFARWMPREKSKFGYIFNEFALYCAEFSLPSKDSRNYNKALLKCKTMLRKKVAELNRYINTPQINQCANTWSKINFEKDVTSITFMKQKRAFLNEDNQGKLRHPENTDRMTTRDNLKQYLTSVSEGKIKIKAKNVDVYDYVKSALFASSEDEKMLINESWKQNGENLNNLKNIIAMVDNSGSMEVDNCKPLYSAVGLGIRVAEKSSLGRRVLTFSADPSWINLEDCDTFTSAAKKIKENSNWGMNTDFKKAMFKILEAIKAIKMPVAEVEKLVLAVFSDMQWDDNTRNMNRETNQQAVLFDYMKEEYRKAGLAIHGIPYKMPHILFWNMRTTDGFPCLSDSENVSMLSGNNPVLLNNFEQKGVLSLKEIDPWKMLTDQLNCDRYNHLEI